MKIEKILNNNVVVTRDEHGRERIVMGRGLAFDQKIGLEIAADQIEKTFTLTGTNLSAQIEPLFASLPLEHILLSQQVIAYAKEHLAGHLSESIYLTLTDHISSAITRFKQGIVLKNPLAADVKRYYPDEFAIGCRANELILKAAGVAFNEDEAAFIALHFVNAELGQSGGAAYQALDARKG